MTTLQTPQALIEQITLAFAHVDRQDIVTLHQAIALDNYESGEAIAAARFKDTDTHWTEIQRETLVNFESALSFLNEQGTRYYLPAFMIAALEGHIDPLIPFFKITNLLGSLRKSTPDRVIAAYGFDQQQVELADGSSWLKTQEKCFVRASDRWLKPVSLPTNFW